MSISPAPTGGALPLLKAQPQPPHPAPTLTGSTQDKDRENTELDGTQAPGTLPPEIREGPVPHLALSSAPQTTGIWKYSLSPFLPSLRADSRGVQKHTQEGRTTSAQPLLLWLQPAWGQLRLELCLPKASGDCVLPPALSPRSAMLSEGGQTPSAHPHPDQRYTAQPSKSWGWHLHQINIYLSDHILLHHSPSTKTLFHFRDDFLEDGLQVIHSLFVLEAWNI